ncbi:DUF1641 domain-containing protein [Alicyclobacillus acidoterrestris]|uniref:DUF1641 domain-containing protein n=1 Tax=Alicyclobacillus acidoterrestris (strain ATCC 49025 / DSM 3922 / CIP 106132 / NCIMB 13137 / GD3B) TaxID=1356854 RepID=T0DN26_ALIAG|nr:DUF1641 domain-containing protein [Alicyclobacillus acidoterrestris]EPZ52762.1 hypothetical protein N007_19670 [Alicyclobacillus acidoterrestris ATCC 49025]UNO49398.1 DUF1641 domain-containing protein [Alicyclobacillus acidoterrestris]
MAQPTTKIKRIEITEQDEKRRSLQELQESVADHQEALQSLLTLIQDLESSGVLEILHALLNSKEKVASIALEQILKPSVLNTIKNAMTAMGVVSKIDPEQLGVLMEAFIAGLHQGQKSLESNQRVSMFNLVKAFRDPGVNRALTFMLGLLQGLGQKL